MKDSCFIQLIMFIDTFAKVKKKSIEKITKNHYHFSESFLYLWQFDFGNSQI
ncbi:MAG: hypothetical protein LBG80_18270 [Bacteroidales bacterium]|jgi:hypothetical protein|nr:hypothetical protein [Bacteroidales bacterium]